MIRCFYHKAEIVIFFGGGKGEKAHFEFLAGPGNLAKKIRQKAELNVKFCSLD
jgi:hypothetical protein